MTPDQEAIAIATKAFADSMRRQWIILGLSGECPIKPLSEYSIQHRQALVNSIAAAVSAAKPENIQKIKERQS